MSVSINMAKNRRFEDEGNSFGERHVQMFILCFGLLVGFAMRVNLSVAIVAMTELPIYHWSEEVKGLVLSSFFWGYVITQVPAGLLARKFGGKVTVLTGVTICSVLNVVTPFCARVGGWQLLCAARLLEGLCQGVLYPSYHTLISAWAPPREREMLGTFAYVGAQFGTIVMLACSGMLASHFGWESIFYASGGAGCLWVIGFYFRGASTPADSKSISNEERQMIQQTQAIDAHTKSDQPKEHIPTPWLAFFTSPPFWAVIATHCSSTWGFWTLLTQIPSYMKNVLGKDIKANALLSSLPYTLMFVLSFFFVWMSKCLQKRKSLSMAFSRKFFNTIGQYVPMVLLIALAYVPKEQDTCAVVLLSLTVGMNSASQLGYMINHIDLSPNFAGVMMGITNGLANIMGIAAPLIKGIIVSDEKDVNQWRIVFFIAAAFYFVGNGLFLIFGQAHIQEWNDLPASLRRGSTAKSENKEKTEER